MGGEHQSTLSNLPLLLRLAGQNNEIVSAARVGSPEVFSEFYALYSRRLYRTIIAITRNPADAEDALQETFLKGYSAFHTFEGRASVFSWLTRIAMNSALLVLRKRRSHAEIFFDPHPDSVTETLCFEVVDPSLNPEEICDLRQRQRMIQRAIRELDPGLREPLVMWVSEERSIREIGRALNLSEAAVKTRLHRARARLSVVDRGNRKRNHCSASG